MAYILEGLQRAVWLLLDRNPETFSAIVTTLKVSSLSIGASLALGIPAGFALGHMRFRGRSAVRTCVDTLLAFPTVVIGLLVYALVSRRGPLGDMGLLFTLPGIAIGQTILGLPIVTALTANAVEGLDRRVALTLHTLGAAGWRFVASSLWESRFALLLAAVAAYGRIVSEVGISMMVGGNIKWHTRTMTTAIALETGKGEFAMGIALGIVLLLVAFAVNAVLSILRRKVEV